MFKTFAKLLSVTAAFSAGTLTLTESGSATNATVDASLENAWLPLTKAAPAVTGPSSGLREAMRITQNTLFDGMRRQVQTNTSQLLRAQEQVATQKRINRLSDNPVDGGRVLDLNTAVAKADQYLKNIERISQTSDILDKTYSQVSDIVTRATPAVELPTMAAAYVAYTRSFNPASDVTVAGVLTTWQRYVDGVAAPRIRVMA